MTSTENSQALANKAINSNRRREIRHHVLIISVCLGATLMVGLTGIVA